MGELTMKEFGQEYFRLSSEGAHAQAYKLVTREAGRFPERAQGSYYNWRMCSACLMGDGALALQLLKEALAAGHWYDEAGLREDTDLASLQGLPEFERLVELSLRRRSEALAQAKPMLQTFEPEGQPQPYPLLLALHGNISNLEESARYWRLATAHGWLVAAPQSSQVMGKGRMAGTIATGPCERSSSTWLRCTTSTRSTPIESWSPVSRWAAGWPHGSR
jgi:hypothetical protein